MVAHCITVQITVKSVEQIGSENEPYQHMAKIKLLGNRTAYQIPLYGSAGLVV